MKTNERTLKMMDAFVERCKNGKNVLVNEIAEEFGVSKTTVYGRLAEIAERLGVTRDDLKQRDFFADHSGRNYITVKPVDRAGFEASYQAAMKKVRQMSEEIEKIIADVEVFAEILEEEKP